MQHLKTFLFRRSQVSSVDAYLFTFDIVTFHSCGPGNNCYNLGHVEPSYDDDVDDDNDQDVDDDDDDDDDDKHCNPGRKKDCKKSRTQRRVNVVGEF